MSHTMRRLEKEPQPIGWGSSTLKKMLAESEARFEETGELCFALYTPEGDLVSLSTGIIVHVHTMSDAIKYMIRNRFEENPGIAPGDIFINNDPLVGDVHNADVQTLVPIFWEGEIIGWAGGGTHEIDIGALTPRSVPIGPTHRFEDGIDCPVLKCGANDTLFRDHELRCEKATRTPMYWKLDERARVAGCHMIRKTVEETIQEVGIDTYKAFIREVIEEGRGTFLNRIREMTIPGRYRAPAFSQYSFAHETRLPVRARVDKLTHAPLGIEIHGDGTFELSFEGADAWGWHSMNCTPSAMQGAIWVLLTQTIIPNDKVNDGAYLGTKSRFPLGSWTNPGDANASTEISWFFLIPGFTGMFRSLGRAFQAHGYVEEVLSGYGLTGNCLQGGGIDHLGKQSATTNFEMSCVGSGAGMARDGLDFASAMWNPEGDMGDVEVWELPEPFGEGDLYLSTLNGGTGLGDPHERYPALIEEDLGGGYLLPRYPESIYGAHIEQIDGRYKVDVNKTGANREAIRQRRRQESVPVKNWIDSQRKRILGGDFIQPVKSMYRSSMELSPPWATEFRQFWNLPDDFEIQ